MTLLAKATVVAITIKHKIMEYLIIIVALYFLPVLLAWKNKADNRTAIGVLNLFLGWTLVGWVIALMMAVKDKK